MNHLPPILLSIQKNSPDNIPPSKLIRLSLILVNYFVDFKSTKGISIPETRFLYRKRKNLGEEEMVWIPEQGFDESNSTTDAIISLLGSKWPLSARKIHHAIRKKHIQKISYQAVHKALQRLVERKVLSKEDNEYYLNPNWIKRMKLKIVNIEKAYANQKATT
jgi:hypothetical protein